MLTIFVNCLFSNTVSFAGLEMDPTDPDIVWAASNTFPPNENSPCGVAKINIATGTVSQYIDLSGYKSAATGVCMPNDLVFDDNGNLYVTDFYGYQVWSISTADFSVSVVNRSGLFVDILFNNFVYAN